MNLSQLIEYLKTRTITTHAIALIFLAAVAAFKAVPQFHDLVMSVYNLFPAVLQSIVVTAFALYAWYRDGGMSAAQLEARRGKLAGKAKE